jgi:hypothetical protein
MRTSSFDPAAEARTLAEQLHNAQYAEDGAILIGCSPDVALAALPDAWTAHGFTGSVYERFDELSISLMGKLLVKTASASCATDTEVSNHLEAAESATRLHRMSNVGLLVALFRMPESVLANVARAFEVQRTALGESQMNFERRTLLLHIQRTCPASPTRTMLSRRLLRALKSIPEPDGAASAADGCSGSATKADAVRQARQLRAARERCFFGCIREDVFIDVIGAADLETALALRPLRRFREDAFIDVIGSADLEAAQALRYEYAMMNGQTLESLVREQTRGDVKDLLLAFLSPPQSAIAAFPDLNLAVQQAAEISLIDEGTTAEPFVRIFGGASSSQLVAIMLAFARIFKTSLPDALSHGSVLQENLRKLLLTRCKWAKAAVRQAGTFPVSPLAAAVAVSAKNKTTENMTSIAEAMAAAAAELEAAKKDAAAKAAVALEAARAEAVVKAAVALEAAKEEAAAKAAALATARAALETDTAQTAFPALPDPTALCVAQPIVEESASAIKPMPMEDAAAAKAEAAQAEAAAEEAAATEAAAAEAAAAKAAAAEAAAAEAAAAEAVVAEAAAAKAAAAEAAAAEAAAEEAAAAAEAAAEEAAAAAEAAAAEAAAAEAAAAEAAASSSSIGSSLRGVPRPKVSLRGAAAAAIVAQRPIGPNNPMPQRARQSEALGKLIASSVSDLAKFDKIVEGFERTVKETKVRRVGFEEKLSFAGRADSSIQGALREAITVCEHTGQDMREAIDMALRVVADCRNAHKALLLAAGTDERSTDVATAQLREASAEARRWLRSGDVVVAKGLSKTLDAATAVQQAIAKERTRSEAPPRRKQEARPDVIKDKGTEIEPPLHHMSSRDLPLLRSPSCSSSSIGSPSGSVANLAPVPVRRAVASTAVRTRSASLTAGSTRPASCSTVSDTTR